MKISLNKKVLIVAILSMVFPALIGSKAFAISEFKLTASDAAAGDLFGVSVSISGDRAVVGAHYDADAGPDSGSAYVFRYDGSAWVEEAKLTASDAAAGDFFGYSASISGDRVVIGSHRDDDAGFDSGSAYVFRYDGSAWVEEAKLTASDAAAGDFFGVSVSISGDRVVVGALYDDDAGSNSGSAYVFRYDGSAWVEEAKLTASDGAEEDYFGRSVSTSGDRVVVGSPYDDDAAATSGSAYVFRYDGSAWVEEAKLTASDGAEEDYFGWSVSTSGGRVVIGSHGDDDAGSDSGSAYVFRYDGSAWVEEAKLTASDGAAGDYFGNSVSISGKRVVVGSPYDDNVGTDSGAAYVFRYDGSAWIQEFKLTASGAAEEEFFGYSVSISGGRVVVGSPYDDDAGIHSGSAYVFMYPSEFKLTASDGAAWDKFGSSVSISGGRVVVGAFGDNTGSGSAYVFTYDGSAWIDETKLTASDGAEGDYFGWSVSTSGGRVAVGSPHDDDAGSDSGSAYLFTYDGSAWIEEAKLTASDAAAGDGFGSSVSISGKRVVVGAFADDTGSGSAYVFRYDGSTWVEEAKLTASDAAAGDGFGSSVSISGKRVVVGSPADDTGSGSAYVFLYDGNAWVEEAKLTASDAAAGDHFGNSVSISGKRVIVGALDDDDAGTDSGSAYVFRYDGGAWAEEAKLTASDAAAGDRFGSVSISGGRVAVGSPHDDDAGTDSGSAYLFRYDGSTWVEEFKVTASDAAPEDYFGYSVWISGGRVVVGAVGDDDAGTHSGSAYVFMYQGAPHIDKLRPRECEPGEKIKIIGYGFGETQGDSIVHIGRRTFDSSNPKIKLWSDTKIRIKVPNYRCEWFRGKDFRRREVWVTVDGADSNKKRLKVMKPAICP